MKYHSLHILPSQTEAQLFSEVIDACYPNEKTYLAPEQMNIQYLKTLLVLLKNDSPCARLAVYFNPEINGGSWLIGQYECINDPEAATCILNEAIAYIRQQGGTKVIGPMNGSTWENYRFAVSGQAALFFTEYERNPWYAQQFIQNGFAVNARYFSGKDSEMKHQRPEVLQRKKELENAGIVFRKINVHAYEQELIKIHPFLLEAFSNNHLYSPIDANSFVQKYLSVQKYMDPDFVLIAEDAKNETVGVFFCLPDHFNTTEKGIVIKTIARKNSPGLQGLGHVMAEIIYAKAHERGMQYTIHAFMHQQGTSVNISKNYSGESIKQYALYEKSIQ